MLNLETGQEVLYKNKKWNVLYVWRNSENVVVRITLGRLEFTDIDGEVTTWGVKRVDASPKEISECKHELTAKEYAEKLREMFGVKLEAVDNFADLDICNGVNCQECPFDEKRLKAAGYHGNCAALMVYHPELAVKLMDEWQAEKNKPKGKTYLEDIRERLPNVFINKFGIPEGCRKRLCNGIACTDCMPGMEECRKCWNEVMPEEENAEG